MTRWTGPRWVARAAIALGATAVLAGAAFTASVLLEPDVVDIDGCRLGPSAGRLMMQPGEQAFFSVPLPRAESAPARIVQADARGTIPDEQVRVRAVRTGTLGELQSGWSERAPRRTRALKDVRLRSYETERVKDPATPKDRAPWSMVVSVEPVARGIFHLSALDLRYASGERVTRCKHDLSVTIAVGEPAPDVARTAPVYVGAGYGHNLHTHCGIFGTTFGGLLWTADPPLHDGSSNPPPMWSNPFERGTMKLIAPDVAVFETRDKLQARFRPRAPQDPPLEGCD